MEDFLNQAVNYGFPMVVAWYLLVRIEDKLEKLSISISQLSQMIEKMKWGWAFAHPHFIYEKSFNDKKNK